VSQSEPIACTLSAAGQADQATRWRQLLAHAGIARESTEHGVRLAFHDEPAVELTLRELVAVEADCCRWATWRVTRERSSLVLHMTSSGDGVAALHTMFAPAS
jgi:hypothetical protein